MAIERITDDAFDQRFYLAKDKVNPKTGNNYFPAFHFLTRLGAPTPVGLQNWYKSLGYQSDHVLHRSMETGSYVHDCIDRMIKTNIDIQHDEIELAFPDAKEAEKVKMGLLGAINFITNEEPDILGSESKHVGEDFGFTLDLIAKIKSDNYKNTWVLDWKTSKVVNEDHKMQVEAIRRVIGADKAGIIVVGNTTKKKYTFTAVKPSEADYLWERFQAIKEAAYVEILKNKWIQPREDIMPLYFSLKDLNLKRHFDVSI